MTCPTPSTRRGAALFIVLASLVLTTVFCAIAAQSAALLSANRRMDRATRIADELLRATDAPIRDWLATTAPTAVLPPDAIEPRFDVMRERLPLGEFEAEITITAFDQLGMVPHQLQMTSSQLMAALPSDVVGVAAGRYSADFPIGLDSFEHSAHEAGRRVYPRSHELSLPALGSLVATHNANGGAINVNTAPLRLVEAAMLEAGRGGIESIVESRSRGEAAMLASRSTRTGQQNAVAIVARSDVWSFRIDVHVGPVMRSWWCVYQSSQCVQRLVIPE